MPLYVEIRTIENGEDTVAGTIILENDRLRTKPTPGNENLLKRIIRESVRDPNTKQEVSALTNPEQWMRALAFTYKSAYLRATHASLIRPGTISPGSQQPTAPAPIGNAPRSPQTSPQPGGGRPPVSDAGTPQTPSTGPK